MSGFVNFVSNRSILSSMVFVAVVPVIAVLALSAWVVVPKLNQSTTMARMADMTELGLSLTTLVHEQQKERGATAVFVGSAGASFAEELEQQRLLTNVEREVVIAHIAEISAVLEADPASESFANALAEIGARLTRMDDLRARVDDLTASQSEAVSYYTNLNALVLKTVKDIARFSADVQISSFIASFAGFLEGKERAGIERAIGAGAFASGLFRPLFTPI